MQYMVESMQTGKLYGPFKNTTLARKWAVNPNTNLTGWKIVPLHKPE